MNFCVSCRSHDWISQPPLPTDFLHFSIPLLIHSDPNSYDLFPSYSFNSPLLNEWCWPAYYRIIVCSIFPSPWCIYYDLQWVTGSPPLIFYYFFDYLVVSIDTFFKALRIILPVDLIPALMNIGYWFYPEFVALITIGFC